MVSVVFSYLTVHANVFSLATSGRLRLLSYWMCMPIRTFLLVAQLVIIGAETPATKATRIGFFTRVDSHVAIPSGSVIKCFAANWTFFALFWIAHARRSHLLHVVIQLKLIGHCSCLLTKINSLTIAARSCRWGSPRNWNGAT